MIQDPEQLAKQQVEDINAIYEMQKERQDQAHRCIQELVATSTDLADALTDQRQQWEAAATQHRSAEKQLQRQQAEVSNAEESVRDARRQLQDLQASLEGLEEQLQHIRARRKHRQTTLQLQLTLFDGITNIRFDKPASEGPPYSGTVLSHGSMRKFAVDPAAQGRVAAVNEVWRVVGGGHAAAGPSR